MGGNIFVGLKSFSQSTFIILISVKVCDRKVCVTEPTSHMSRNVCNVCNITYVTSGVLLINLDWNMKPGEEAWVVQ